MNEEQTINHLPKDWKWVTFNDVCHKIGDIDHKMPKHIESGYPYVSTKDFTDNFKISFEKTKYISKEDFLLLSKKIKPEKGDIIFPRYGTIGKNILIDFDKEFLVSYSCAIVKPNTDLTIPKYIYLYSLSPRIGKEIKKYVVETTQANIGIASIKRFVFPLPPISQQKQIVSKIEELFSEVDKGIEEIETAQQQLKVYRQAVLKCAFEGKLTNANWAEREIPKGWKQVTLKEISDSIQYGYTESSSKQKIGPKFLRITDIQENKVLWEDVPYCKINDDVKHKYLLRNGDLVFARTGATVGKSFLIKGEIPEAVFASYLIRVRINKNIEEKYLSYFFHSPLYWSQITDGQVGIAQPNVNGTKLGQLLLPLPTLAEQQQIVQEIESRLSVCDKIEETITNSLKQAEALRQSILKKAFEGKLLKEEVAVYKPKNVYFYQSQTLGYISYYSNQQGIQLRCSNKYGQLSCLN